ncbi:unnamed protein product [Bursaphelenchus okinawaensis]|uniref:CUB domain-containing protein n=1 Tax=Bursaphelenchus okinawaensis TaxID=465554 RepID=A0A811JUG7_9BILA|nr:unnamed protein product [Bursaphelenchus okinawaensis]CAG9083793.1 unnamed protein product [Bursaphelenchus okinawaensis]
MSYLLLLFTVTLGFTCGTSEDFALLTECDGVFNSVNKTHFSLPILPKHLKGLKNHMKLPNDIQCRYTFVAGKGQRVKLEFTQFQLDGTVDNCDLEYMDIYSELSAPDQDLLSAIPSRYCGTVSPHVRVSLHNVIVLVFHSRVGKKRTETFQLKGKYNFINETKFIPGSRLGEHDCAFLIEPTNRRKGQILSSTYPGTYPSNFHCSYLLKGNAGDRIRLYFRDFDIYFGGEHCPYDVMTVYDGHNNKAPIIRKVCGLQQRLEMFSFGSEVFLEFNSTDPAKNDPRGYLIEYEFSDNFVDIKQLLAGQRGVSYLTGSECDVRVQSNRETVHYIQSPNYPNAYPPNTTCTYILDGLQGDQNLEKVILNFENFAVISNDDTSTAVSTENGDECWAFVGVAGQESSIKSVLANNEESVYDATLCHRIAHGSPRLGPYTSQGPRMVLVFGSLNDLPQTAALPLGFKARVEFKTDFGVPGSPMGGSNECLFQFREKRGHFNSPRYPANYPLDTTCTYIIKAEPGEQILLYFEQFALFEEPSKEECNDWLEVYDVARDGNDTDNYQLQAKHCWTVIPGPTTSSFGYHEMKVVFNSNQYGTANGFMALYEIRKGFKDQVPEKEGADKDHCGGLILADAERTSGWFTSPGFGAKYTKDLICDWEIKVRPSHQVLLQLTQMDVEGEMTDTKVSCKNAVIKVHQDYSNRTADLPICGTNPAVISPIVSIGNSIRISFLTSPDKVNGLNGFNFTWTEIRMIKQDSECADDGLYLCSYTRYCIDARLRCNGDDNCGHNDDTDEAHCNILEKAADSQTLLFAAILSGFIFLFIFGFFCLLFKKKLEKKSDRNKDTVDEKDNERLKKESQIQAIMVRQRQRHPFRQQQPKMSRVGSDNGDYSLSYLEACYSTLAPLLHLESKTI